MSYNDPTDIEAVLQKPVTPPAASPVLRRERVPFSVPFDPIPNAIAAPPTPVGVPVSPAASPSMVAVPQPSGPPLPIQSQNPADPAALQLVPVAPVQPPIIAPSTTTPLIINGVASTPQRPDLTTPGVTVQV